MNTQTAPARFLRSSEEQLLLSAALKLCPSADMEAISNMLQAAVAYGAHNAMLALGQEGGVQ